MRGQLRLGSSDCWSSWANGLRPGPHFPIHKWGCKCTHRTGSLRGQGQWPPPHGESPPAAVAFSSAWPALPPLPGPAGFLHEQPAGHLRPHALSLPPGGAACPSQKCTPKACRGAPTLQPCVQGLTGVAYHIMNRQQLLRQRVGTRHRSSTDCWALAEATSSSVLDVST